MNLTDLYEKKIIDFLFGGTAFTMPSKVAFGLIKNTPPTPPLYELQPDPTDGYIEPDPALGYHRVEFDNDKTLWSTPANNGGPLFNNIEILFPTAAGGDWGTVNYIGIFEPSGTSENLIAYGLLATPINIVTGTKLAFPPNSIQINLD